MQHLWTQTEGTDWNALLPVPDRRPMIVPPPYTNRNLIQEGWTELCPHPNLEKAVIEQAIARWGDKFKNATSDNSWFFAKRRLEHYNKWNKQWIQQYGTVPALLPGLPALPGRRPSISSMAAAI